METVWLTTKLANKRHYVIVMTFVVVAVLLLSYGVPFLVTQRTDEVIEVPQVGTASSSVFARSLPVRLLAPAIGLDTTFVAPLGLNTDQTVSVPDSYTAVGWYMYGATPGEVGPSVILGHVDSFEGPAVFYDLGQLEPGDEVRITREDGSIATFTVDKIGRYAQDEFPTELVYGPTDYPALRLVTCTGTFDRVGQRYSHNLVVFATLVDTSASSAGE